MLRPCLENSLRPLYEGLSGIQHLGNLEEGLNRRGARDLDSVSDATATRRRRDGDQTARRGGNTGKALGSGNTGQLRRPYGVRPTVAGDLQEGLNRRSARNLTHI